MPHNVAYFLAEQAAQHPHGAAVRAPVGREADGAIRYVERSFSQLDAEASATAHYFVARGIKRGTRVLLMVKPGLDLIRIVFALFRIGAVPIVIDPGMGLKRFLRCVRHSQPEALVGIPPAIWVARLFRPSFSGVSVKLSVGSGFEKKIAQYNAAGGFPRRGLSRRGIGRSLVYFRFDRTGEGCVLRTRHVCRAGGGDSYAIWHCAWRSGFTDVARVCFI